MKIWFTDPSRRNKNSVAVKIAQSLTLCGAMLALPEISDAREGLLDQALEPPVMRGEATFRFLGFPVYEARLFTPEGQAFDWEKDFGLELTYLRRVSEDTIVSSTLGELERIGEDMPVEAQLQKCFEPVNKGDTYLAVTEGENRVTFWLNGSRTCTLTHPEAKFRFMSIFLGEDTRSASFTRRLRGE